MTSNALQELHFGNGKNYVEDGIEIRELIIPHLTESRHGRVPVGTNLCEISSLASSVAFLKSTLIILVAAPFYTIIILYLLGFVTIRINLITQTSHINKCLKPMKNKGLLSI